MLSQVYSLVQIVLFDKQESRENNRGWWLKKCAALPDCGKGGQINEGYR